MTTALDPYEDARRRWRPSPEAVETAVAALTANPAADVAVVPLYQPGKIYGIWTTGQRVETVHSGAEDTLLAVNGQPTDTFPSVSTARDTAFDRAAAAMGPDSAGTTAYAVVHRDGHWAVFEEILSARD